MAINKETTVQKLVAMPRELAAQVSDYRFANRLNSEAEAIRRLLGIGLAAEPVMKELRTYLEAHGDPNDPDVKRALEQLRAAT